MKKFIVVYDKTANFTVLENNLVNAGCTILSHLSALHVLTLECADTSFEMVLGVLTVEEEHEITITEHWHLRRITCRQLPLKSLYLPKNLGTNVVVYLVDSGVDISHPQFVNANIQNLWSWDENFTDVNGHGTAMASLIVGESLGVVPEAILKNVQIPFGTSITTSVLLTAFDAILTDHLLTPTVKVVNCSWTVPKSSILDAKITELQSHGLVVVAAAGNDMVEADILSPVGLNSVLGVAASDAYDRVISWASGAGSNWGPEVDITAPGIDVEVATLNGATEMKSGTSMAAAIVAGAVCQFIVENSLLTALEIQDVVITNSTSDILFRNESIYGTTPNNLLHTQSVQDAFLTPVVSERIVNIKVETTHEIPITYVAPLNSINIYNTSVGTVTRTAPSWITLENDILYVTPPHDLPAGKYRIFIQGLKDDIPVHGIGIVLNIYVDSLDELDDVTFENYFVPSDDNTVIIVKAASCFGGCFGNTGTTCVGQGKGCVCSSTSGFGTCLQT
jgi:hypothetical protein